MPPNFGGALFERGWRVAKARYVHIHNLPERLFRLLVEEPEIAENQVMRRLTRGKPASKDTYRLYNQYLQEGWVARDPERRVSVEVREGSLRINPRGFGFVVNPDYPGDDVFIPERWLLGAMHDDRVLVWVRRVSDAPGPEGRVMTVLKRAVDQVVGQLQRHHGTWRVVPRDARRPVVVLNRLPKGRFQPGDMVTAVITDWPRDSKSAVKGNLGEVLGNASSPGMDIAVLAAEHHLSTAFPPTVLAQAGALAESVQDHEMAGRLDLRDQFIVTIDGADAKDLDDAISLEKMAGGGYEVGVHIADVSYYVEEDTDLDLEARQRGTSTYLVDRVIPMLPERLSNGIASLNPGVPRLTFSAFIRLNEDGRPVSTRFARSVIQTNHRLTYDGVNRLLAGTDPDHQGILPWLQLAHQVRDLLSKQRVQRGAIDFDIPEAKIVLDKAGLPVDVVVKERGVAESIIEEFMLLANEAVARELLRHRLPGMFRVHHEPSKEKMEQFRELVAALGYPLPKRIVPKALQELLTAVKDKPEERLVSSALLRSMQQAKYSHANTGHFGLASSEYTHFTSPIRRYPDLWVHRVLTAYLERTLTSDKQEHWAQIVPEIAELCSTRERAAMDAERDSVALKEAQFMSRHIGDTYPAVVSGVTSFGMFVELPNLIEGLVRLEDFPRDEWTFDAVHLRMTGQRSGVVYRLGSEVTVQVTRVDVGLRRIDFGLVVPKSRSDSPAAKRPNKSKGGMPSRNSQDRKKKSRARR